MKMPLPGPSLSKEVLEKDIFRFDFLMRSGQEGKHLLFDDLKIKKFINTSTKEDNWLSINDKNKLKSMVKTIVILPTIEEKKNFIETLSFQDQKQIFQLYLSMLKQYKNTHIQ